MYVASTICNAELDRIAVAGNHSISSGRTKLRFSASTRSSRLFLEQCNYTELAALLSVSKHQTSEVAQIIFDIRGVLGKVFVDMGPIL